MYIFSRRVQMSGAHLSKSTKWAVEQAERVSKISGLEFSLWADMYGPRVGSLLFSTFVPDLATMVAATTTLMGSDDYLKSIEQGSQYLVGPAEDTLIQLVNEIPDPSREVNFVAVVSAVIAEGNFGRAPGICLEIADRASKITGLPTLFGVDTTGCYGGVRWITGAGDIAELEHANSALATDASFTSYLDHDANGCFAEEPALTQQALLRRIA